MNAPKKSVVITGVTGQDGAYLTQLLLDKGYKVYKILYDYRTELQGVGKLARLKKEELEKIKKQYDVDRIWSYSRVSTYKNLNGWEYYLRYILANLILV